MASRRIAGIVETVSLEETKMKLPAHRAGLAGHVPVTENV